MRKTIVLTALLCLAAVSGNAQGVKLWTEGPLTWDDFQTVEERGDASRTSFASFSLYRENKTVRTKGISYKYQDVCAMIAPAQSCVLAGAQDDRTLAQYQQEFDILQHFAVRYREDFMFYHDTKMNRFEEYFDRESKHKLAETYYVTQYRQAVERFRQTGEAGGYPVSREPFDVTAFPVQVASGASEGLVLLSATIPVGRYAELFHPGVCVSGGYGYQEGKGYFRALLSVGNLGVLTEGISSGLVWLISNGTYVGLSGEYGRIVGSWGKVNLSLFGGVGYSAWKQGHLLVKTPYKGFVLSEGLCVDIHLHRTFNFLSQKPQAQDSALQVKLHVDEMYIAAEQAVAPSIHLGVGMNFGFRNLSRQNQR